MRKEEERRGGERGGEVREGEERGGGEEGGEERKEEERLSMLKCLSGKNINWQIE